MNFGSDRVPDEPVLGRWICPARLAAAKPTHDLSARDARPAATDGREHNALALNEVSLFRMTYQAVKVEILVDGQPRGSTS
jgi:NAD+ kinase